MDSTNSNPSRGSKRRSGGTGLDAIDPTLFTSGMVAPDMVALNSANPTAAPADRPRFDLGPTTPAYSYQPMPSGLNQQQFPNSNQYPLPQSPRYQGQPSNPYQYPLPQVPSYQQQRPFLGYQPVGYQPSPPNFGSQQSSPSLGYEPLDHQTTPLNFGYEQPRPAPGNHQGVGLDSRWRAPSYTQDLNASPITPTTPSGFTGFRALLQQQPYGQLPLTPSSGVVTPTPAKSPPVISLLDDDDEDVTFLYARENTNASPSTTGGVQNPVRPQQVFAPSQKLLDAEAAWKDPKQKKTIQNKFHKKATHNKLGHAGKDKYPWQSVGRQELEEEKANAPTYFHTDPGRYPHQKYPNHYACRHQSPLDSKIEKCLKMQCEHLCCKDGVSRGRCRDWIVELELKHRELHPRYKLKNITTAYQKQTQKEAELLREANRGLGVVQDGHDTVVTENSRREDEEFEEVNLPDPIESTQEEARDGTVVSEEPMTAPSNSGHGIEAVISDASSSTSNRDGFLDISGGIDGNGDLESDDDEPCGPIIFEHVDPDAPQQESTPQESVAATTKPPDAQVSSAPRRRKAAAAKPRKIAKKGAKNNAPAIPSPAKEPSPEPAADSDHDGNEAAASSVAQATLTPATQAQPNPSDDPNFIPSRAQRKAEAKARMAEKKAAHKKRIAAGSSGATAQTALPVSNDSPASFVSNKRKRGSNNGESAAKKPKRAPAAKSNKRKRNDDSNEDKANDHGISRNLADYADNSKNGYMCGHHKFDSARLHKCREGKCIHPCCNDGMTAETCTKMIHNHIYKLRKKHGTAPKRQKRDAADVEESESDTDESDHEQDSDSDEDAQVGEPMDTSNDEHVSIDEDNVVDELMAAFDDEPDTTNEDMTVDENAVAAELMAAFEDEPETNNEDPAVEKDIVVNHEPETRKKDPKYDEDSLFIPEDTSDNEDVTVTKDAADDDLDSLFGDEPEVQNGDSTVEQDAADDDLDSLFNDESETNNEDLTVEQDAVDDESKTNNENLAVDENAIVNDIMAEFNNEDEEHVAETNADEPIPSIEKEPKNVAHDINDMDQTDTSNNYGIVYYDEYASSEESEEE